MWRSNERDNGRWPRLAAQELRWRCDPAQLPFESTEHLPPLDGALRQDRAASALEFGLQAAAPGFNLFVAGDRGTGRTATARTYVEGAARLRAAPSDWCYLYNFANPDEPRALRLSAGQGKRLADALGNLITAVRRELRRTFESAQYREQQEQTHRAVDELRERLMAELNQRAQAQGLAVAMTPGGPVVAPVVDGRPMTPEEAARLSEADRERLRERGEEILRTLRDDSARVARLEQEVHQRMAEQSRQAARLVLDPLIRQQCEAFQDQPAVVEYLNALEEDILTHLEDIHREQAAAAAGQEGGQPPGMAALPQGVERPTSSLFDRYQANVLVDNRGLQGAPVVYESNPTYYNLLGRIEYRYQFGAMATDFRMIKPGALHRANGGYLLLDALDLLSSPFAWDALKRALTQGQIRIENIGEQLTPVPAATLRPEPIPLDVKVVLVGPPHLYYLLYFLDEDFPRLFRVRADLDTELDRTQEHLAGYAAFVADEVRRCGLRHFHREAVARLAEYGARLAEHQRKLSARFDEISDIIVEASYWAEKEDSPLVMAGHVARAVERKRYRSSLIEDKIRELVEEGTVLIDTSGQQTGQVNGLSVLDLGDYRFGRPVRITAQVALGIDGVLNLEREARLSGPIHNKGFLILTSFLAARYAQDKPLALSARIAFEQTYDEVEGDSAASSELYALLSSLAGLPLRQDIAVTGSVNQRGEVQAVGGVTQKVEGFFDVCKAHSLTGDQGVIIPAASAKHLMLREDVVAAVEQGRFHVWPVETIDQGIEILTGTPAGAREADGRWQDGTVNGLVDRRLHEYAQRLKEFGRAPGHEEVRERAPAEIGPRTPRFRPR